MMSVYISSKVAEGRVVPDSCCKTITLQCGKRDHPSNIYKVEVSGLLFRKIEMLSDKYHINHKYHVAFVELNDKMTANRHHRTLLAAVRQYGKNIFEISPCPYSSCLEVA